MAYCGGNIIMYQQQPQRRWHQQHQLYGMAHINGNGVTTALSSMCMAITVA